MQGGVEVIDRPGVLDDFCGGRGIGGARVRERGGRRLQAVKLLDAFLVGDGEQHDVAPFLGASDGEEADARRRCRQCAAVGIGGGGIREFPRRAGDSMQEGTRRGDGGGLGKIGNPGGQEAGLRGGGGDFLRGRLVGSVGGGVGLRAGVHGQERGS